MKKALLVTTVSGFVPQFEMNHVRILQQMGYEVHYASNFRTVSYGTDNHRLDGTGIIRHQIDFSRSPFQWKALKKAYCQLKQVMKEQRFDLVHCHTPVGAALARLVARPYRKQGTKVIYTAHGFHFYKGAPLKYWLFFYPAERWLARFTDVLITINEEDYGRANRFCKRKRTRVEHIPGVGIDTAYWSGSELPEEERKEIRRKIRGELGISKEELAFVSVGELIPRKNHRAVIQAFAELYSEKKETCGNFRYFICGQGTLYEELGRQIEEAGLSDRIALLGYREDIRNLLYGMDIFVFPSFQEGLPVALMEAIAAGLPVIASDIRGNRELASLQKGAQLFSDRESLKRLLQETVTKAAELKQAEGKAGTADIGIQALDRYQVNMQMQKLYKEVME